MRKLYEKHEVLFAVLWIVLYCVVMASLKGAFGYESPWALLALLAIAAGILAFVKANRLEEKYGLASWPKNGKKCLYFIPMWILATCNLWDGISLSYHGAAMAIATLSMILVGFVEEMLFRGFLFRGMLREGKTAVAIVVSALTFGMGHIVNLFAGQASFETFVQIFFAVAWGFLFTMVAYKGGSLLPCILAHAMIDVFALYGADNPLIDWISIGLTIAVSIVYCLYLARLKEEDDERPESEESA